MYFLPEEEVSYGVSAELENNIKLTRKVALPLDKMCWENFIKSGTELVFYLVNVGAGEITSLRSIMMVWCNLRVMHCQSQKNGLGI